jgi:hypothetical protein
MSAESDSDDTGAGRTEQTQVDALKLCVDDATELAVA